jgi:hypothetical protein
MMKCGDRAQAGILGAAGGSRYCPRCESQVHQRYQWKPDLDPRRHKRRCYDCGWESGWVPYDEWIVHAA